MYTFFVESKPSFLKRSALSKKWTPLGKKCSQKERAALTWEQQPAATSLILATFAASMVSAAMKLFEVSNTNILHMNYTGTLRMAN